MDEQGADNIDIIREMGHYLTDPLSLDYLYRMLRLYIIKANFVTSAEVDDEANELLQNLIEKALTITDKYHGGGIRPWLLSIAHQLLKQRMTGKARRRKHELSLSETYKQAHTDLSEEEFFDKCMESLSEDEVQRNALRIELQEILLRLSRDDQRIIYYYFEYGLNHNEIAQKLNITPGTARVRCHRILLRLRRWIVLYEQKGGDYTA